MGLPPRPSVRPPRRSRGAPTGESAPWRRSQTDGQDGHSQTRAHDRGLVAGLARAGRGRRGGPAPAATPAGGVPPPAWCCPCTATAGRRGAPRLRRHARRSNRCPNVGHPGAGPRVHPVFPTDGTARECGHLSACRPYEQAVPHFCRRISSPVVGAERGRAVAASNLGQMGSSAAGLFTTSSATRPGTSAASIPALGTRRRPGPVEARTRGITRLATSG